MPQVVKGAVFWPRDHARIGRTAEPLEEARLSFRNAAMELVMLKRYVALAFILLGPVGCVTQDSVPRARADGPAYMQPGIGAPARQTDSFGNALR
jgi:hypothetical protein